MHYVYVGLCIIKFTRLSIKSLICHFMQQLFATSGISFPFSSWKALLGSHVLRLWATFVACFLEALSGCEMFSQSFSFLKGVSGPHILPGGNCSQIFQRGEEISSRGKRNVATHLLRSADGVFPPLQ